jgi:transmembrane protein EpsG
MNIFVLDFYEKIVWFATILMCIIAMVCRQFPLRRRGGIGQPLPNPIAVILPIVFFTVVAALRKNVGDTFFYAHSFELMGDDNIVSFNLFTTSMFSFFQNIIRNLTDDPQWLIAFTAVFATPIPIFILYKYSYPFDLALYLFLAYGYFGGLMNGVRQYMATAIFLCATRYLFSMKRGAFFKYAIIVLLAYFMHSSALIMIPIYFVVRRKAWQLGSYVLILGSVVAVVIFDKIMPSFLSALETTSYSGYATNGWFTNGQETGTSVFRVLVTLAPLILAYMNRDRMKLLGHIGDILINLAFINVAIYTLSLYNWIFARVAIYMSIYFIILLVWVIYNAVNPKERSIYYTACVLLFFIYSRFISYMISGYESDYFFPGRKLF